MKERLQKILSRYGISSRRAAEQLIEAGVVTVNGKRAYVGESADAENDIIVVDGRVLANRPAERYIVLYKPRGYVTTMKDERERRTVADLVKDCGDRVYPVGRLDMNSEGLVIMTNDGDAALDLSHPSRGVQKVYRVTVNGIDTDKVEALRAVEKLDGEPVNPPTVEIRKMNDDRMTLIVTLTEGKNREIRRMCEQVSLEVLRLKRLSYGDIGLGDLKPGQWRNMEKDEIKYIKSLRNRK